MDTFTGVLIPDAWTECGDVSGFALCTADEQKFVLKYNSGGDSLMAMLRQNIKVSGIMVEEAGESTIIITNLQSLSLNENL